jgi:hypothetical protein
MPFPNSHICSCFLRENYLSIGRQLGSTAARSACSRCLKLSSTQTARLRSWATKHIPMLKQANLIFWLLATVPGTRLQHVGRRTRQLRGWLCWRALQAKGAASGIAYLHSFNPPILHRDLRSPNLLVDQNWTIKVRCCCQGACWLQLPLRLAAVFMPWLQLLHGEVGAPICWRLLPLLLLLQSY